MSKCNSHKKKVHQHLLISFSDGFFFIDVQNLRALLNFFNSRIELSSICVYLTSKINVFGWDLLKTASFPNSVQIRSRSGGEQLCKMAENFILSRKYSYFWEEHKTGVNHELLVVYKKITRCLSPIQVTSFLQIRNESVILLSSDWVAKKQLEQFLFAYYHNMPKQKTHPNKLNKYAKHVNFDEIYSSTFADFPLWKKPRNIHLFKFKMKTMYP